MQKGKAHGLERGGFSSPWSSKLKLVNDEVVVVIHFPKIPPFIYSQGGYNISKQVCTCPLQ